MQMSPTFINLNLCTYRRAAFTSTDTKIVRERLPITDHGSTNKSPKTKSSEVNPSMEEPGSLHYIMEQMMSVRVWYPYAHAYPSAGCSYTTAAGCGYCW